MLVLKRQVPLDYSLCSQTVTVYHREGGKRTVLENAYYDYKRSEAVADARVDAGVRFLLIVPGDGDIRLGDKVMPGVGGELADHAAWAALTADSVPGLGIVKSVSPQYWQGKICHVEARGE